MEAGALPREAQAANVPAGLKTVPKHFQCQVMISFTPIHLPTSIDDLYAHKWRLPKLMRHSISMSAH
jgi:hypothetical protein